MVILNKQPGGLNCPEAYGLWDLLSAKYQMAEKLQIWRNYAHDKDLKYLLNSIVNTFERKIVVELEKQAEKYYLNGPEVGVKGVNTSANTEIIRDELIAQDTFLALQGITDLMLRNLRIATTNDSFRKKVIEFNKINLRMMDNMISFLRLKGWINEPPIYPNLPQNTKEVIDAAEAFHLWDNLTFRYDNIHQTEIYKDLVKDLDLKALITLGLQLVLKEEASRLEKECLKFGIPLPKHPERVVALPSDMKFEFRDDAIFRVILMGIIGATNIHVSAVKQSVTNDRVRKLFINLLLSEIEVFNHFILYGKLKGYLNEPPKFK